MKVTRQQDLVILDDGTAARHGVGVLVPALLVGLGFMILWPVSAGTLRGVFAGTMFVATAFIIARLRAPRRAEFDLRRREVRITIGWPPRFGRRITIAFDDISDARPWRPINLFEFAVARPALFLKSGGKVMLSGYNRTAARCREITDLARSLVGLGEHEGQSH